jgi:DNA-binding transcriptional LysR family regulator
MQPTPRALELAESIGEALGHIRSALARTERFDPATAQQRFHLTTADYSELVLLPRLMPALARQAPGVDLRMLNSDRITGAQLLEAGEADIAFMPFLHNVSPLRTRTLFRDSHVCIAAAGHPALAEGLTLEAYVALPHVLTAVEGRGTSNVDSALAAIGLSRRIGLSVPHFLVVPFVVAATRMIATVPTRLAEAYAGMAGLALHPPPVPLEDFSLQMVWHQRSDLQAPQAWLRELIAEVCAD